MPDKKRKQKKHLLKAEFAENKQLLIGISAAIFMLILASFGAKSDFFRSKKESKPIPTELTDSLTPTPTNSQSSNRGECVITGCSGQICSDEEVITTCEYNEIYSCYENAKCEVQIDGECGWTMDESLSSCLQSYVGEPSI